MRFFLCSCMLILSFFSIAFSKLDSPALTESPRMPSIQGIVLNQIADMKLVFLGIPQEYVNQTELKSRLQFLVFQFVYPSRISWTLNYSFVFAPFPTDISDALQDTAFSTEEYMSYNVSLLENLLSQHDDLSIPDKGYLLTFMWIPNATRHTWFYIKERPDVFFNMTYHYNGNPGKRFMTWLPHFGGISRSLYFDVSEVMENATASNVTTIDFSPYVNHSLPDIFPSLSGSPEADTQTCANYTVKILCLNGTEEKLPLELIEQRLEELMPWTNWTVTIETKLADEVVNSLIRERTTELPTPINQTYVLSNGNKYTIISRYVADWIRSEYDPLTSYFIDHLQEYFDLTDLSDKSIVPVIFFQLDNDTTGAVDGACYVFYRHNMILAGLPGSILTSFGEYGQIVAMYLLTHEIGHWMSLTSHSYYDGHNAVPFCVMLNALTSDGRFCSFCKDARARMSYISYYSKIATLLLKNQSKAELIETELNSSLQLFYKWQYMEAVEKICSIYFNLDKTPPRIVNVTQTPSQESVQPEDSARINASVTDDLSGVKKVSLSYTSQNGSWTMIEMTNIEGEVWTATIPAFPLGTSVAYVVTASDNFKNAARSPEMGSEYQYYVIPEFSSFPILPIAMITLLLSITVCRRKYHRLFESQKNHVRSG